MIRGLGNARARFAAVLLCVAAIATGCGDTDEDEGGAGEGSAAVAIGSAELKGCGPRIEPPGFRCGSIRVPFERSDPSYGTTKVTFAVRRRDQRNRPSLGTIFAQEGGPGYSNSGIANWFTKFFSEGDLLERRELVIVDMRGTGLSDPYACPDLQQAIGPESLTLAGCARRLGERFISYRTSAAVDDMNDVRRALGVGKILLYGDSYGTFFGQSYAFRHGETLKALVLDSAYPTRGESAWYGSLIRTGNRSLEVACRRSPDCSGDAGERLAKLVDYLRRTRRGVGGLLDAFGGATYGTPESYLAIDQAGIELRHGNEKPWRRLTRPVRAGWGDRLEYVRAGELAVGCNDYPMIWDKQASEPDRRVQLEQAIRRHPDKFGPFTPREIAQDPNFGYLECLTWPPPTDVYEPPVGPDDEPTEAPVLLVSGEMDNLTTPQEGERVAETFPNSELVVVRNAGHIHALINRSSDPAAKIHEFLRKHSD